MEFVVKVTGADASVEDVAGALEEAASGLIETVDAAQVTVESLNGVEPSELPVIRNLGRLDPVVRRRHLQEITAHLAGHRVRLVLSLFRDSEREVIEARLIGWAVPMFGTIADMVIVQQDGNYPAAYSVSRVVSIEPAAHRSNSPTG